MYTFVVFAAFGFEMLPFVDLSHISYPNGACTQSHPTAQCGRGVRHTTTSFFLNRDVCRITRFWVCIYIIYIICGMNLRPAIAFWKCRNRHAVQWTWGGACFVQQWSSGVQTHFFSIFIDGYGVHLFFSAVDISIFYYKNSNCITQQQKPSSTKVKPMKVPK